jgi:hypothetical protein
MILGDSMRNKTLQRSIASISSALLTASLVLVAGSPADAAKQYVSTYSLRGDCADYYEMNDEYAMFEEEEDWTCTLVVALKPAKPARTVLLQFYDKKWKTEATVKTNSNGIAYLRFGTDCGDSYCDATFTYRAYVNSVSGQAAIKLSSFDMNFYPIGWDDEEDYWSDF